MTVGDGHVDFKNCLLTLSCPATLREDVVLRSVDCQFGSDRQDIWLDFALPASVAEDWLPFLHMHGERFYAVPRQPLILGRSGASVLFRPFVPAGPARIFLGLCHRHDAQLRLPIGDVEGMVQIAQVEIPPIDTSAACARNNQIANVMAFRAATAAKFPLFISNDDRLCASPRVGRQQRKAAVISLPKAGTYLVGRILELLGFEGSGIHLSLGHLDDYRKIGGSERIGYSYHLLDILYSSRLVLDGQFIATHIEYNGASRIALDDFARFYVRRELRNAVVSAFREAVKYRGRSEAIDADFSDIDETTLKHDMPSAMKRWFERKKSELYSAFNSTVGWMDDPNTLLLQFEQVMGDFGSESQVESVMELARSCGIPLSGEQAAELLSNALGSQTITFSGKRTVLDDYWSGEMEQLFVSSGFQEINDKLGYGKLD